MQRATVDVVGEMFSSIRIGFSTRRKNPVSRVIRWVSKSRFSHAWIVYYHPIYHCDVVVEADAHGIVELSYGRFRSMNDDVLEMLPPDDVSLDHGMTGLGPTLGTPYDYGSLIGRAWVYLGKWLGRKVRNPLRNVKKDCCVEHAYKLLQCSGQLLGVDPEQESPQDLHDRLALLGWRSRDPNGP
jgi:hypothetical protein